MAELIKSPYQLICEGKADEIFFSRLLKASGRLVNVACPKKQDIDGGLGKTAMHKRLMGLQAEFDKITRVILVVDSDDDPASAFTDACGEFAKANTANPAKKYPIPINANTIAQAPGSPDSAIVLIPDLARKGCLDTLLLPSFEQIYAGAIINCVDEFCECVKNPTRGETRDSKLRLRAIIAASQHKNPGISLSLLLEAKNCPIDLAHNSFARLSQTLTGFFP